MWRSVKEADLTSPLLEFTWEPPQPPIAGIEGTHPEGGIGQGQDLEADQGQEIDTTGSIGTSF